MAPSEIKMNKSATNEKLKKARNKSGNEEDLGHFTSSQRRRVSFR